MDDQNEQVASFGLGDGTNWQLVGWSRINEWVDELDSTWAWTAHEPQLNDPSGGYTAYIVSRISQLRSAASSRRTQGQPPASFADDVRSIMDRHAPFHPASEAGQLVLDIRSAAGADAAIFAHHLLRNTVNPGQANNVAFLRGAMMAVEPSLLSAVDRSQALKTERANYKRTVTAVREEYDLAEARRQEEWNEVMREAGDAAQKWARRLTKRWLRYSQHARRKERASINKLHATDAAFTEQMGLKAPVKYWKDKAKEHGKAEFLARIWVIAFFMLTLPGMAYVFNETGVALINQALEPRPEGSAPFPNAIFLIASAGLASCAGIVFWAGRLLTKLYLSQHHLRQDAEERATMTETYLALIENNAASTEDRQVILNALFRNTPDGIVKEEGGLDPSIAAALGKYLAKP